MSIKTEIDRIEQERTAQTDLINQIKIALQNKVGGFGYKTCTITVEYVYENLECVISYQVLEDNKVKTKVEKLQPGTYVLQNVVCDSTVWMANNSPYNSFSSEKMNENAPVFFGFYEFNGAYFGCFFQAPSEETEAYIRMAEIEHS